MLLIFLIPTLITATVVRTYVSSHFCKSCDAWTSIIEKVSTEFPALEFETEEFDVGSAANNVELPYTMALGQMYKFPKREDYLLRWLLDVSHGRSTVFVRNVSLVDDWHVGYTSWVHILSDVRPQMDMYARSLLQTGFAWTRMSGTVFSNTVTYRRVDGTVSMRHNVSDMRMVVRDLLPHVVPFSLAKKTGVQDILDYFDTVVYLVSPEIPTQLPMGIAWVHFSGNESHVKESNMSVPSAWYWRRDIEFTIGSVDVGALTSWMSDIEEGVAVAHSRPSVAKDGELSGDDVWDWVASRKDALIVAYASSNALDSCIRALAGTAFDIGKIDIRFNDHETFPTLSKHGAVHHYHNGVRMSTRLCDEVEPLLYKEEL